MIAIRLAWMEGTGWVTRLLRRAPPADEEVAPDQAGWRQRLVIGWAGMRGAITLAVLLAVPHVTGDGHVLAGRDDIIYLGFAVIIVTLVGQGTTLPVLVERLRLTEHPSVAEVERQARLVLTQAVLKALQNAEDAVGGELVDGMRAQYLARLQRLESSDGIQVEDQPDEAAGAHRALRRELVDVQQQALARLRREGRIGIGSARTLEYDLDLEDARLS